MKKIELAREIATLENDIRNYRGQEIMEGDKMDAFITKMARAPKEWLDNEIDRLINVRGNAKKEYYRKAFAISEAGTTLRGKLNDDRKAWMEDAYQQALATVQEVLGDDWTVAEWGSRSFKVGMKNHDTDPKAAWRTTQFGHDFNVYFGYAYDYKVFKFEANIGTCGSFNIASDDSQLAFYIGIGKFLSSPKVQVELRNELKQLRDNIKELDEAWDRAEENYVSGKVA